MFGNVLVHKYETCNFSSEIPSDHKAHGLKIRSLSTLLINYMKIHE